MILKLSHYFRPLFTRKKNMFKKIALTFLLFAFIVLAKANYFLIPMDATQANHLKAYGVAFQSLKNETTVQWLLNYKGGSFLISENSNTESLLRSTGVSFEMIDDTKTQTILSEMLDAKNGMNLVTMERMPKVAVYSPPTQKPYDDAVTLALTYAGIDYTVIYDKEVLKNDLRQFDWIHLHHEDFTGQYGKWEYYYKNQAWYQKEKTEAEAMAKELGFAKVSQLKLAVAKKLKGYVENGGQLFAMCAATDALDVALAAQNTDILAEQFDGDATDKKAQSKLDFAQTFAFQNFTVEPNPFIYEYANIDIDIKNRDFEKDKILLATIDAKKNLTGAMLSQNHLTNIKSFAGQTTAFNTTFIKPEVEVLATNSNTTEARYIHGKKGKGTFTFYSGHDPEISKHFVGGAATDLNKFKQSAGYRLILNNVLFPSVSNKTLGISDPSKIAVKVYPNPFVSYFTVDIKSAEVKQAKLTVYNLAGQLILSDNINSETGSFSKKYTTENLSGGLYLVEIFNEKGVLSKTLLAKADN